jgi:hypothetical protein
MLFRRQSDVTRIGWFRTDSGRRRWRLSAKLLIVSSIATVIGFSAICVSVMLDMRRGEEELARQTLENLAAGIDSDISRNIELYDLSLRAVASNLVMPEIKGVSKEIQHLILFDHAATAKHFGVIQVFDAQGRLTHDAASLDPAPEEPQATRSISRSIAPIPIWACYMSRPMLRRGAYSIVLSRRINDADGGFLGVVVGSIRFTYFHDLFGRLTPQPRRYDHGAAPRPNDHHADAVRPRRHRQEPGGAAKLAPGQSEGRHRLCRRRAGRSDTAALRSKRQHEPVLCRGRKAAGEHPEPLAPGSAADRSDHAGADPVRGQHHAVPRARRSAAAPRPSASWRRWQRPMRSPG